MIGACKRGHGQRLKEAIVAADASRREPFSSARRSLPATINSNPINLGKTVLEVIRRLPAYFQRSGVESARLNIEHLLAHVLARDGWSFIWNLIGRFR